MVQKENSNLNVLRLDSKEAWTKKMDGTVLTTNSIYNVKTGHGRENLITFKIEKGLVDTDHPSGQETYYDLRDLEGHVYRVAMAETYCKKHDVSRGEGTYIGFYFPLEGPRPELGETLTVKLAVQ